MGREIYARNVRESLVLQGADPELSEREKVLVAAAYGDAISCAKTATAIRAQREVGKLCENWRMVD